MQQIAPPFGRALDCTLAFGNGGPGHQQSYPHLATKPSCAVERRGGGDRLRWPSEG